MKPASSMNEEYQSFDSVPMKITLKMANNISILFNRELYASYELEFSLNSTTTFLPYRLRLSSSISSGMCIYYCGL